MYIGHPNFANDRSLPSLGNLNDDSVCNQMLKDDEYTTAISDVIRCADGVEAGCGDSVDL